MLSALCEICKIYKEGIVQFQDKGELEKQVKKIYEDCKIAGAIYNRSQFRGYKELEVDNIKILKWG